MRHIKFNSDSGDAGGDAAKAAEEAKVAELASKMDDDFSAEPKQPDPAKVAADKAAEEAKVAADKIAAEQAAKTQTPGANDKPKLKVGAEGKEVEVETPWSTDITADPAKAPVVEPPADDLKKENEALKKMLDTPSIKAMIAASANGKGFFDVVKELMGSDPDNMKPEELFKKDLVELGITDVVEVEDEVLAFNRLPKSEQLRRTNPIKEKLKSAQQATLNEFGNTELSLFNKNLNDRQQAIKQSVVEYQELVTNLKGQKLFGVVEVTDEMTSGLQEIFKEGSLIPIRKDGSMEPAAMLEFAIFKKYRGLIFDTIGKTAAMQTYEQMEKKIWTPENPGSISARTTASLPTEEQMDKDFEPQN